MSAEKKSRNKAPRCRLQGCQSALSPRLVRVVPLLSLSGAKLVCFVSESGRGNIVTSKSLGQSGDPVSVGVTVPA